MNKLIKLHVLEPIEEGMDDTDQYKIYSVIMPDSGYRLEYDGDYIHTITQTNDEYFASTENYDLRLLTRQNIGKLTLYKTEKIPLVNIQNENQ